MIIILFSPSLSLCLSLSLSLSLCLSLSSLPLHLSLSLSLCVCVCPLWCVLQFRTLKQSKIPVGEETQVQGAGGVTTETSWCWQNCLCLCLPLSFPSCFLPRSLFISSSQLFFPFNVNVHITIYLHLLPSLSLSLLSSTGRALFLLSADVVLFPVWAPQRPVGSPSARDC